MTKKVYSEWRNKIVKVYGKSVAKEVRQKVGNSYFLIRDIIDDGMIPSVDHCKPNIRKNYINCVLRDLELKGKIKRQGKAYYFAREKAKHADH